MFGNIHLTVILESLHIDVSQEQSKTDYELLDLGRNFIKISLLLIHTLHPQKVMVLS